MLSFFPTDALFPLIKLAKKLKEESALKANAYYTAFPLIKLAKKLKDWLVRAVNKFSEGFH